MQESPKYLLNKKRYDDLEKVTKFIAIYNEREEEYNNVLKTIHNMKISLNNKLLSDDIGQNSTQIGFIQDLLGPYLILFGSKLVIIILTKLIIIFLALNILMFGFMLNLQRMEGDAYINLTSYYLADLVAKLFGGVLMKFFEAFTLLPYMFILSSLLNIAIMYYSHIELVRICLYFLSCITYSTTFIVSFAYVTEIFDPTIKATAFIFLMGMGTIGVILMGPIIEVFATPFHFFALVSCIPIPVCFSL